MGVGDKDKRSSDTISLLEYGYSMYGSKTIIDKTKYEKKIYISNSKNREVKYYLKDDVKLVVDKNTRDIKYKVEEKLLDVKAPLEANSKVGTLYLKMDNTKYEYDLIVKEYVEKANYFKTFINLFKDVINGNINTMV